MKIKYAFADETVEIEVSEEWGNISSVFLQALAHEARNRIGICFCVHNIAQSVSRAGKRDAVFLSCAGAKDLPAHVAGHKAVILAVDQQDGNMRMLNRFQGACFPQIKMSEQSCSQPDEGHDQCGRQVHILPADLTDDGLR